MICTFDTEGTTVTDARGTYGVLYYWDFCTILEDPERVYPQTVESLVCHDTGRDCTSLYNHLHTLLQYWEDSGDTVKVAVHNLTYDFGYLRHFVTRVSDMGYTLDVRARNSTHLISCSIKRGKDVALVFYDSLALFRTSLRSLGDALGYRKLELDYYRAYAPDTVLGETELAYNTRDTELLSLVLCRNFLSLPYVGIERAGKSILTKTGMVKAFDRDNAYIGAASMGKRTVYDADRYETYAHQFSNEDEMQRWNSYSNTRSTDVKGCYAGGVNLANGNITGCVIRDVEAYDLTSAYPGIMLAMRIPSKPVTCSPEGMEHLLKPNAPDPTDVCTLKRGFWIGTVRFEGFRMRQDWRSHVGDSSLTLAMARQNTGSKGIRYEDGYLVSADSMVLTVATPTFYELCCEYEWGTAVFTDLTLYMGIERPTVYQNLRVLYHYAEKTCAKRLSKGDGDAEEAYRRGYITYDEMEMLTTGEPTDEWMARFVMSHKENLNGLYGILVQNPVRDSYGLTDSGYLENLHDGCWDTYISSKRDQKMWREAGVLTSLFNRYKIIYAVRKVVDAGGSVLYTDTDSIKVTGLDKSTIEEILSPMHENVELSIRETVSYTARKVPQAMPELDEGFYKLGKFDWEGHIKRFYTPGHKKYAMDLGDGWKAKCAGYSVKVVQRFMDALTAEGFDDIAPLMALGYDVRYDSSTDIATVLSSIEPTWVSVEFEALDSGDAQTTHTYTGETCPGYAVLKSGKIMNNTDKNELNTQRMNAATRNNPQVDTLSRIDVAELDGSLVWGKRGTVPMQWSKWDLDRVKGDAII